MSFTLEDAKIGIIGLGYVGLPLAVEFGKKFNTTGFDINKERVAELRTGFDSTLECSQEELEQAKKLNYSSKINDLKGCNVFIVSVPTPIDKHKQPDLTPLLKTSEMLGGVISKGDTIIYESTVYPGATEEECIPIVEKVSGLTFNKDFFAGYSPERINPGDKKHRLANILKVTSGSNEEISYKVDDLYNTIVTAGTHRASSIKVAEASKVIENVQRDVNIALINELHQIFSKLDINTKEVIEAASTKWNFMKLMPGLVGGHCIGVDPYYLLHKAQGKGFVPDLIRAAREVNDSMADFLIQDFISSLLKRKINPVGLRVLLLGFTFKENCPDIRNTKVIDIYNKLNSVGFIVDVYDPWVDVDEAMKEYDLEILKEIPTVIDVGFMAVGHDKILELVSGPELKLAKNYIFDYKNLIVE